MLPAASKLEHGMWEICDGIAVECPLEVLDAMRRLAVDGFNAFAHGGKETGGVLYGIIEPGYIRVVSFRELECEHALGPRFRLSENDHREFSKLLEQQPPLRAVGWFRAHTRGTLELDATDREMFSSYFPDLMQIGLVLKPTHWGPASVAFFVRGASGDLLPPAPREIAIEPLKIEETREPSGEMSIAAEPEPAASRREPAKLFTVPAHLPASKSDAERTAGARFVLPDLLAYKPLAWLAALCAVAVIAVIAAILLAPRSSSPRIKLLAYAVAPGQVRIEWNRSGPLDAGSATLSIEDGTATTRLPLSASQIRSGNLVYVQHTAHITARLQFDGAPGNSAEETVDFVGEPSPAPPAVPAPVERTRQALPIPVERAAAPPLPAPPLPAPQEPVRRKKFQIPTGTQNSRQSATQAPAADNGPAIPAPPALGTAERMAVRPTGLPAFLANTPEAGVRPVPAAAAKAPAYAGPHSGRLIWTGVLGRRGVVEVDGGHVSTGSVSGSLPGVPVTFRVLPAEFSRNGLVAYTADPLKSERTEAPSQTNGWNAMHFKFDGERAGQLTVLESPNRSNEFKRLVLRNEGRDCPVVVVEWTVQ